MNKELQFLIELKELCKKYQYEIHTEIYYDPKHPCLSVYDYKQNFILSLQKINAKGEALLVDFGDGEINERFL